MKTKIHINQHIIRSNAKTGEREPVITCKTYKRIDMDMRFISKATVKSCTVQTNHYHVVQRYGLKQKGK